MNTSGVPPIRITSNIGYSSNCNGTAVGESYYKHIDLTDERCKHVTVRVQIRISQTYSIYKCRVIFSTGTGGFFLNITLLTSITG